MPDSPLPPSWGPAPFDERDLDAVLSGETTDIPVALRPVADTLAALQAAPLPAELCGQATIMAEFRALAEFRAAGLAQGGRAGDPAQTLVLSGPQERLAGKRAPRHRRRAAPVASWRTGTLISAAAVAAVVLAVVLTGTVPGPFHHHGSPAASTSSPARQAGGNSSSPKVEGSATKEPTAPATDSDSATAEQARASYLCHAVYGFIRNPGPHWKQERSLWRQLTKMVGSYSPLRVATYCATYVGNLFPHGTLQHIPGLGDLGTGSSQVGQDNQLGALAHP